MIARGDIELYRRDNKPIPEGWGLDREGNRYQDAAEVLDHGVMLPFGEHKGSALSIMIELLAGPLISDMTSLESTEYDEGKGGYPLPWRNNHRC
jgi:LDH2 family malate/lactate/ureidoglycolate dehydrogenase